MMMMILSQTLSNVNLSNRKQLLRILTHSPNIHHRHHHHWISVGRQLLAEHKRLTT